MTGYIGYQITDGGEGMSEYMAEHIREWKVERCELHPNPWADVLTVTASLRLDREYMADHRRDVGLFMENLAKGPATVLPSEAVNELLDENAELRERLEELQDRLDEIRDAVKVLREMEEEE